MLIKYMDELGNLFDLKSEENVSAYLAELKGFSADKGLAEWEIAIEGIVPRQLLHYDDTSDGGNNLNGSWREFFASKCEFGVRPLFSGSSIFYKDGSPNFGGIAKATIYLRFSVGFLKWIESFDAIIANKIREEIPSFENLIVDKKTKKLLNKWANFKAPKGKWALPVICSLSDGSKLVLGLSTSINDNWDDIEDLGVNIEHSLELMSFLETPKKTEKVVITNELQMGKGQGRNAFGEEYKLEDITVSEYTRLMGPLGKSSRKQMLDIWAERLEFKVKVAPNPETSELIFMPEGDLKYSSLKRFIDSENDKKQAYFKAKNNKDRINEDSESAIAPRPSVIPVHASVM